MLLINIAFWKSSFEFPLVARLVFAGIGRKSMTDLSAVRTLACWASNVRSEPMMDLMADGFSL